MSAQKGKGQQKRRRRRNPRKGQLNHDQASDSVVWSIVRRHNSKRRGYCNFNRFPNFTPQTRNLSQLDTFRTSGYRSQTVGVSHRKSKKTDKQNFFVLKMNKRRTSHKPRTSLGKCQVAIGGKRRIGKQVDAQTKFRFYRPELCKLAQKRMWKVMQNRSEYKRRVRKQSAIDKRVSKYGGGVEDDAGDAQDPTMQVVD